MLRAAMLGALVGAAVATSGWAQQAAAPEAAAPAVPESTAPADRSLADLRAELRTLAAELKSLRAELNVSSSAKIRLAVDRPASRWLPPTSCLFPPAGRRV